MSRTHLLDTIACPILEALEKVPTLTSLDVSDNQLGVLSSAILARLIASLPAMRSINLAWNNLGIDVRSTRGFWDVLSIDGLVLACCLIGREVASWLKQWASRRRCG